MKTGISSRIGVQKGESKIPSIRGVWNFFGRNIMGYLYMMDNLREKNHFILYHYRIDLKKN